MGRGPRSTGSYLSNWTKPNGHVRTSLPALCFVVLLLGSVAAPAAGGGLETTESTPTPDAPVCAGTMAAPANGITVASVQGARFHQGGGSEKTPARLVAFGPEGRILWVHHSGRDLGVSWSYDVDPLPNGNVFVTATRPGRTLLYELDAATGERVWSEQLPFLDTHDADPLNRTHIVIANMRNPDEANGTNDDRVVVYDREADEIVREWRFADRYDRSVGGDYADDWTHLNDVDAVALGGADRPTHFLLSPRNFDQVILVNRSTGAIDMRLGSDQEYDVLHEQHNPDFLRADDGTPTFLVADSENDRIVEYARGDDGWTRTWQVGSGETLAWPRDADRLRNGHTLVGDSRNNRVLEVTPRGEVVWEVYAPWLVYDAERIPAAGFAGDGYRDAGGSRGPTMTDIGGDGDHDLSNAAPPDTGALERCARAITAHEGGFGNSSTATPNGANEAPATNAGTATQVPTETTIPGFGPAVALAALLAAALGLAARGPGES